MTLRQHQPGVDPPTLLVPGECTEVTCSWTIPSGQSIFGVTVVVDPDESVAECRDGNNRGAVAALLCSDIN